MIREKPENVLLHLNKSVFPQGLRKKELDRTQIEYYHTQYEYKVDGFI